MYNLNVYLANSYQRSIYSCLFFVVLLSTSGCAVSFVNDEGKKRVIGFVDLTLGIDEGDEDTGGQLAELSNVGILFSTNPISTGIGLGYTKETTIKIKNDVLILMDNIKESQNETPEN